MRKFLCSLLLLLLIALFVSPIPAARASESEQARSAALEDGRWIGHYWYEGLVFTLGYISAFRYAGPVEFTISDGSANGEWEATVTTLTMWTKDDCTLTFTSRAEMKGVVEGTARSPILRDTEVVNPTFESKGGPGCDPQLGLDQSGLIPMSTQNIHISRPVNWTWVTCEQAYGHMGGTAPPPLSWRDRAKEVDAYEEKFNAAGISMSVDDEIYMVRAAALRPSAEESRLTEEIERLFADFSAFVDLLAPLDEPITPYLITLDELLARTESLARELQRLPDCAGIDREAYASMLASGVARLIEYVLENPARATVIDLYRLIMAGVRTELFYWQPLYLYGEETLRPRLLAELERRTAETSDCVDLIWLDQAFTALGDPINSAYTAAFAACGG